MYQIIMRFKSGKEYKFKCESYNIYSTALSELTLFSYKNGVGECPIYYNPKDVESIAIIKEEKVTDEIAIVPNCYKPIRKKD